MNGIKGWIEDREDEAKAVKNEAENTVEDAKGFFEKHKVSVIIVACVLFVGAVTLAYL